MYQGRRESPLSHFALGACLFLTALAFLRPAAAARGAANGLSLCAKSVIPAIFPLLVLSQILLTSRAASFFALPFRPYVRALKIGCREAASAVALGWLGGFACGAQSVSALYRAGAITRRDAELLLCCTVGSGPAFVVGAVGTLMLGSTAGGAALLSALLAANLCTGLVMSFFLPSGGRSGTPPSAGSPPAFADAVRSSVQSMLTLCGFVVFFAFACGVILPEGAGAAARWLAAVFLEVTNACEAAAAAGGGLRFYLCCASLSIMGASVFLQVRSLTPNDVRLFPLAASRLVHLPLSLFFSCILLALFPAARAAASPVRTWMPLDAATAVFLMLCVVLTSLPSARKKCIINTRSPLSH